MDRRTFIVTSACFATTGGAWSWLARAADTHNAIAVVDTHLESGRAFADYARSVNMPAFEVGDDISMLWYSTLMPRLAAVPSALFGCTRASDWFVLNLLAASFSRTSKPPSGTGSPMTFLIEPAEAQQAPKPS